uniref:Uncharacterized protein n=1 Tax=Tanacetum cinerariifolium TaxID=118510 RepID=A0A6L2MUU8_TANCI|nr:hypothetical protein [Tanacetum cinerariifolium]
MKDENPIRTLRDYSKPSHEGYRNTIELPIWNNVVTLRSDTIRKPYPRVLICKVPKMMKDGFLDLGGGGGKRNKSKDYGLTPSIDVTCTSLVQEFEDAGNGGDAAIATVSPSFTGPGVGLNPPPSTQEANAPAGNAPVKPSYAIATRKPSGKNVNVRTLFTFGGNGIDVVVSVDSIRAITRQPDYSPFNLADMLENGPWFIWNNPFILKKWHLDKNLLKEDISTVPVWVKLHGVPVTAFSEDGLSAIATKLGTPLMLDSYTSNMCMQSWARSSYARVMIELRANVELKDNIVVAMPKITREGHYTCNVRVEYEWKPPRCSSCKVFRHIHEERLKNTGAGKKNTVKKPSQTSRGVPNDVEPTIEVSNSNPFDILNSVDNDVEFGTNGGTTNLVNNGATSSGSSFMHIDYDGEFASNTPIDEKIDEIERQFMKRDDLERMVTKEDVKKAVWDCGSDKSPGPDGFSFSFFRHFWSTIEKDIFEAVDCFFTNGDMPNGLKLYCVDSQNYRHEHVNVIGDLVNEVQSAFVADRQILDGPFILNERVVDGGLFTGIKLNSMVSLSHLFYADDAIFIGQWSELNIDTLVQVLECFYRASGLRINMCTSKIMGVNVEDGKIQNAASKLGCLVLKTLFTYLGE